MSLELSEEGLNSGWGLARLGGSLGAMHFRKDNARIFFCRASIRSRGIASDVADAPSFNFDSVELLLTGRVRATPGRGFAL